MRRKTAGRQQKDARKIQKLLEEDEDEKLAKRAMQIIFGITNSEIEHLYDLFSESTSGHGTYPLKKLFERVTPDYRLKIRAARDKLGSSIQSYEAALRDTLLQRIAQQSVDNDMMVAALVEAGTQIPGTEHEDYEIPGYVDLEIRLDDIQGCTDERHSRESSAFLLTFLDLLETLFVENGQDVTHVYVQDMLTEFDRLGIAREKLGLDLLAFNLRYNGEKVQPFLAWFNSFGPAYKKLKDPEYREVAFALRDQSLPRPELVELVVNEVEKLKQKHAHVNHIPELLEQAHEDESLEAFDYLCARPEHLVLFQRLKRIGVSADDYLDFLFNVQHISINGSRMLDIVLEISEVNRAAAKAFMDERILQGPNFPGLIEIARAYPHSNLLIQDYAAACSAGEYQKAGLMVLIGSLAPEQDLLKKLRQAASRISEEDAVKLMNAKTSVELLRRMTHAQTRPAATARAETPLPKYHIDWHDALIKSLAKEPPEVQNFVRSAYDLLDSDKRDRMKSVWLTHPQHVYDFSRDILDWHDTPAMELLLTDRLLFAKYKSRLGDTQVREQLYKIICDTSGNIHAKLHDLFWDGERHTMPTSAETEIDVHTMIGRSLPYDRVIIWGGQYSRAAKEKIMSCTKTPIRIYDLFSPRRSVDDIQPTDMVVWISESSEHSMYYAVKRYCRAHGIGFHHYDKRGSASLIDLLQSLKFQGEKAS